MRVQKRGHTWPLHPACGPVQVQLALGVSHIFALVTLCMVVRVWLLQL